MLDAASSMIKVADACRMMGCMDEAGDMFSKAHTLLEALQQRRGWESSVEEGGGAGKADGAAERSKCKKLLLLISEQLMPT